MDQRPKPPQTPEALPSPNPIAVAQLNEVAARIVTDYAQDWQTQTLDDGSIVKTVTPQRDPNNRNAHLGAPELSQTTKPDGTVEYQTRFLWGQAHDRGHQTSTWQVGGDSVTDNEGTEMTGDKPPVQRTAPDEITAIKDELTQYYPEKPRPTRRQRFSRRIGFTALREAFGDL